ncbi:hypothetical protein [Providencia hangzhouensis]|uniref:hypothetical protein n=1 Tax=Providencia hangzhouensis TaxID=3031799 RepID=UPI0034DD0AFD
MDIESNRMEKISASVKLDLCNYFNWNDIDVNYNIIDIDEKRYMHCQATMNGN